MKFVTKWKLSEIPIVVDREKFCRNHCPVLDSCYMCWGIGDDDAILNWLDDKGDRFLYIMYNDKKSRRRRCPWCKEGGYFEEHTYGAHQKSMEEVLLLETQRELYKELIQVYRTGRWWAIGATIGHCQGCVTPGQVKCSIDDSPRDKLRCILSLGVYPLNLLKPLLIVDKWWAFGFIVV